MSQPTAVEQTAFVTFYSFKGGVGRSMALINVAGILTGRGFKVMALDMDLEAPGISYLMRHESKRENALLPGFVDLLSDACERGEEADLFALEPSEVIERYSYPYQIPAEINRSDEGCLRIMPAGQFDGHYQKRLNDLNLGQLYSDGQGQPLIAALKKVITDAACFDFVFIDSRTGFSDESGICTRDLADYLVVVMGLNRQNQEGTAEFLRSLKETNSAPKGMRIVLSPVPNGEDELLDACEKQATSLLSKAWGKPLDLSLQIPYHPRLALTEEPHIFRRSRGYLYEAYAAIEREVLALMGLSADRIRKQISDDAENKRVDAVLRGVRTLTKMDNGPELVAGIAMRLTNLLQEPDTLELAQFLATTMPAGSWSMKHLASLLHKAANPLAELFYLRLIDADPKDASPHNDIGNLYQEELDRPQDAERAYLKAIELDPKFAYPRNNLGNLYQYKLDRPQDAERAYLNAIELDPKYSEPHNGLGQLYHYDLDRSQDAERAYLRAIELNPKLAHPHRGLGSLYKDKLDRPQDAERAFLKAIDLDPKSAHPHRGLGNLYQTKLDRPQDAERAFLKAIELDPKSAYPHRGLGSLYQNKLERAQDAERAYLKAIELDPKVANSHNGLGKLYKDKLDRPQDAERAYLKAIELDPKNAGQHHSLADLYQFQLSRPQDAEREWRQTLELDSSRVTALQGLVILYLADFDNSAKAREELHKCIEQAPDTFGTQFCACALLLWEEGWERASQKLPSVLAASEKNDPDNWKGELRVFIRKIQELGSLPALAFQLTAAAESEQPWWQSWAEAVTALAEDSNPAEWSNPSAQKIFKFLTA